MRQDRHQVRAGLFIAVMLPGTVSSTVSSYRPRPRLWPCACCLPHAPYSGGAGAGTAVAAPAAVAL